MSKSRVTVKGRKKVLRNLNREIQSIENNTFKGMLAAGLFVEGESNNTAPHDTGLMINSSFTSVSRMFGKIFARVGYTAEYSAIVHEMPETNNFTKTGTSSKFLWKAVTRNTKKILEIIRSRAKF